VNTLWTPAVADAAPPRDRGPVARLLGLLARIAGGLTMTVVAGLMIGSVPIPIAQSAGVASIVGMAIAVTVAVVMAVRAGRDPVVRSAARALCWCGFGLLVLASAAFGALLFWFSTHPQPSLFN
jgi:hypothetical protein